MSGDSILNVVILAAGEGTRMKSDTPKVLFPICGRSMIDYVLDAALEAKPDKLVVVVGHRGEEISGHIKEKWASQCQGEPRIEFAWQKEQLGTGHAVLCALEHISDETGNVMILCGDTPLITGQMLQQFIDAHLGENADLSLITTEVDDPGSYGRVVRDSQGNVFKIVEASDISDGKKCRSEINAGIYLVRRELLAKLLPNLNTDNAKGEFYLTDIIEMAVADGFKVFPFMWDDSSTVHGVNNRHDLAYAEEQVRQRILEQLCLCGVSIRDLGNTYVDYGVNVGKDSIIEPNTILSGDTEIGEGCIIGPSSCIINSFIGTNCNIQFSVVEESEIGENVNIGPYSHIRPKCIIESHVTIGNFAEIKNCVIKSGAKVHHHSYLGDSFIGSDVNIGAGVVTVNYDGFKKHHTIIEEGAFIGCNANLIAPLRVGKDAFIAAGSTVNHDVPDESLAIARERQINKDGWVAKRKKQKE